MSTTPRFQGEFYRDQVCFIRDRVSFICDQVCFIHDGESFTSDRVIITLDGIRFFPVTEWVLHVIRWVLPLMV